MKKRLLLAFFAMVCAATSFALEVGDYAYTLEKKVQIGGANLVTNGAFTDNFDGYFNGAGEEVDAAAFEVVAGVGANGENAAMFKSAGALCRAFTGLDAGGYVFMFDIKGEAATPLLPNQLFLFLSNTTDLTWTTDNDFVINRYNNVNSTVACEGYNKEWKTLAYFFTAEQGQNFIMHMENFGANTYVTNIQLYQAEEVYDTRIAQRQMDYINQLMATGLFKVNTDNDFEAIVAEVNDALKNRPEMVSEEMMNAVNEEMTLWFAANGADMLKGVTRWSSTGKQQKKNKIADWEGTSGRWFHGDQFTSSDDEIGYRYQGGVGGTPSPATMHYKLTPKYPGTYMFSMGLDGYYRAGTSSSPKLTSYVAADAWGNGPQYTLDFSRDFLGVTMYAGKDIMGSDAEANLLLNAEQEGQKVDCGPLNNPYYSTYTVFFKVSAADVEAGTPIYFGITYVPDPEYVGSKLGSNVTLSNPQIYLLGGVTQDEIDYSREYDAIITQQGELKERLALAREDDAKIAADGYPWGHAALKEQIDLCQPVYDASLQVIAEDGSVLNEEFIKQCMRDKENELGILYSDSLLNTVKAMNSARNAFSNANKPIADYEQKVADAETVKADAMFNTGDKATFQAAIDAANAKLNAILASTNDETREADLTTMDEQLAVLAEAVAAFKKSGAPESIIDIDFTDAKFVASETETGTIYTIDGAKGSMVFTSISLDENGNPVNTGSAGYALGYGEEYLDVLRVGGSSATVTLAEADQPSQNDIIRFDFDLFVGNLTKAYVAVDLLNAEDQRIAGFKYSKYDGTCEYNDFDNDAHIGLDCVKYITGIGSSSQSNAAICADNNRSSISLLIDYKGQYIQGLCVNPQTGTCTGGFMPIPLETNGEAVVDNKVAKFVLSSTYSNADRRCWFDNLKGYKYASVADGPIDTAIQQLNNEVANDNAIYNLAGQKLTKAPAKGLYIKNGKKFIVK